MRIWLTVFAAVMQLALALVRYFERKQMLDAAREKVEHEFREITKRLSARAARARAAVKHDDGSVRRDPRNRANQSKD